MAGTVIVGSGGGGHKAMHFISQNYATMNMQDKAAAVSMVQKFIEDVNEHFGQSFNVDQP